MDAFRSLFRSQSELKSLDVQLVEPPACWGAFSTQADGHHYIWRGNSQEKATSIGVYNVQTEQWTLTPTTGPPPPGYCHGACTSICNHLYCFGGWNGSSRINDLYKLNLETFQWSKVYPKNAPSEWPIGKVVCGLVSSSERTLACFGGWGIEPTHVQHGSTHIRDRTGSGIGWTNEFHLFDIQEGVWSSPQLKGKRPPPWDSFTFTKVDQDRAVLFGGEQPGHIKVNDLYLFNLREMEVAKVEPAPGDQWPEERDFHAACCLNYGEDHPMLLVSGGQDYFHTALGDMWILDVDNGKWTKITSPVPMKGRCHHSITATSLGPGLTEVLVFGGSRQLYGNPIAETTILRFERSLSVSGPPTEKWALVDVAHNNTRGSSERLREKREKVRQAESDRVRALEQQLRVAEQRAQDAEQREKVIKHLLEETNHRCEDAKSEDCELYVAAHYTEHCVERRVHELITENDRLQKELEDTLRQKQDVERELDGRTKELAAHNTEVWRIPGRNVSTVRTINIGGWGTVFEGQVKVAVKNLHNEINSPHNIEKVHREMRLLAEVRHPNLLQFIGAVFDRSPPLIITELLDINLRQAYQQNRLGPGDRLSIFIDIAKALDYLHQRYEPIIHRDVSAPNVLLQQMPNNQWKGKVSDLGSANFQQNAQTMGEGAIVYSPPEVIPRAYNPRKEHVPQTTKIDVYSYGVLLCEVTTSRFPSAENYWDMVERVRKDYPQLHALIEHCTQERPDDRPTMETVLVRLNGQDMPQV